MHIVMWEFEVPADKQQRFEEAYRTDGHWSRLFRKCSGFVGTELLVRIDRPGIYVTIDRWASQAVYLEFKKSLQAEYDQLDQQCAELTENEHFMGAFDCL